MPPTAMSVNGVDLSAFAMWVEVPRGFGDGPSRQDRPIRGDGAGALISPEAAQIAPRSWQVEGVLIGQSVADAQAQWDAAKAVLDDVWLEVIFEPWPDRMCVCRYQGIEWQARRMNEFGWRFRLSLLAPSAYLVAPLVDSYGLTAGGEVTLALGTAPSPFIARLIGPATTPTLGYRDAQGNPRGALIISGDLATREWLEIDSQTMVMVRHSATGVASNGAGLLDNATKEFALEPADGAGSVGPTLALDSGSAVIYTRKAYL